ncbi:translation initiation factor 2 [Catenuloplanes atrovinosus]|uniref:Translation initiation factor 2 n=1 Tax=Catenuloplanes atrovinosus TaxID=137266 RepID=A0AAE3YVE6_9ACTN|nr:translation initiation factor 2 [Catenuloplanes atrovinosus]MDR7280613.1 hypothetical protein [Catenuloplanes atrovinosus]
MTTPSGAPDDHSPWRDVSGPPPSAAETGYTGPPPQQPPPPGWRPPMLRPSPPPRRLPRQDAAAIDEAESRARGLSYGVGIGALVVMVIALCAVCGRVLF